MRSRFAKKLINNILYKHMKENQKYLLDLERELKYRNYSPRTVSAYTSCIERFIQSLDTETGSERPVSNISRDEIIDFILHLQSQGNAPKTINLYKEAIKFFLHDVIKIHINIDIRLSREPKKLPRVLTKTEIQSIIGSIKNEKHKFIIALSYGSGLRVSDVVSLHV